MLTPTFAARSAFFYATGNTPATSLTRSIPPGQDATVLALGCGDLRNLLYTAYINKGLPTRKLDVTCADYDEKVIARNILLLSLLHDNNQNCTDDLLWNIYYHLYVDSSSIDVILKQTQKLLAISSTIDAWNSSVYGRAIKFCDADTLVDIRRTWMRIQHAAEYCHTDTEKQSLENHFLPSKDTQRLRIAEGEMVLTALRSAAPLSLQSQQELPQAYRHFWQHGTVMPIDPQPPTPNPLLIGLLSETEILAYGTDPVLGFHIASAFAPLAESSPLKSDDAPEGFRAAAAAKVQFSEWISAFKTAFTKKIVVRYVVAEVVSFCHSLQYAAATEKTTANWYRRQGDSRPLKLDVGSYGRGGTGPKAFDMIDTSNLSDHLGALNLLVATVPLLKDEPWATVYTELLMKREGSHGDILENILCGDVATVSLLLGVSPVQYWTNAKCESHVDEAFIGSLAQNEPTQLHTRVAWKCDDHFSGQLQGRSKINIDAKTLGRVLFNVYLKMFPGEDLDKLNAGLELQTMAYPHFHRGGTAAFLKMVSNRVQTDWAAVCVNLLERTVGDKVLALATNHMQDFCAQMHLLGVSTQPWILNEVKQNAAHIGGFHAWKDIPPIVAVTIVVPRESIDRLYTEQVKKQGAALGLLGSLRSSPRAPSQWHNLFGDIHMSFGNPILKEAKESDDHRIVIEQDEEGWLGSSPLIVSFYVATAALQVEPKTALVGLNLSPSVQNTNLFKHILDLNLTVFETTLSDHDRVFVTKFMPGQNSYPVACGGAKELADAINKGEDDKTMKLMVDVPASEVDFTTITGHLDITSTKGKALLEEKVPIELHQRGPFIIEIVFGNDALVCPLKFPIPVESAGSRTRIARSSGYIEVIAPLAKAGVSDKLSDFIFPVMRSESGVPASLNTPHLNLDNLPVLNIDDKEGMRWLTTLTSLQFSVREGKLRTEADEDTGMSPNPRVNFKESLFNMFMLSSGLQGGQTGLFAIHHPEKGGIHMLIFVSAVRLDGDTASVVLDAAVIPLTLQLIESGMLEGFLLMLRTLECCTLDVNDAELLLWKKALPSLAERCRTWSHKSTCEYKRMDATIPISLESGQQILCSYGHGQMPDNFIGLPGWDSAKKSAVRIAISPTYSVPFVEEVIDMSRFGQVKNAFSTAEKCRSCGKVEGKDVTALKKCTRCLVARYCSLVCQKKDWKNHGMECVETE